MNKEEFTNKLLQSVKVGDVFDNPGGGTSKIEKIGDGKITYARGKYIGNIKIDIDVMYNTLVHFPNGFSSNDLKPFHKQFRNHSCNCTFLMMMLKEMGIVKQIEGRRLKPQDLPFGVKIN